MILKDPTCFSFAFFKVSMAQAFAELSADGECMQIQRRRPADFLGLGGRKVLGAQLFSAHCG